MNGHITRRLGVAAILAVSVLGWRAVARPSPVTMASAATLFLESLTPEQRQKAAFPFAGEERTHWHFIPTELFPRNGLSIKQMSEPQRKLAHELLKAGLSERGYMTATQVMELETVLAIVESGQRAAAAQASPGSRPPAVEPFFRDPERYFFSIFGTPSTDASWGWRVEGHHVSLHFTLVDGKLVTGSPTFLGSNPAEVREGPKKGTRVLGAEEDAARRLLESLDAAQRQTAIINTTAPNDIVTMNSIKVDPLAPAGITASALTASQRTLLKQLVDVYAGYMADDIAANRLARIDSAGWDRIGFAWAGAMERGQKHYYRVQGPTFLIEYDNTQTNANHIHSVWRDFDGDFGADLLRLHVHGARDHH